PPGAHLQSSPCLRLPPPPDIGLGVARLLAAGPVPHLHGPLSPIPPAPPRSPQARVGWEVVRSGSGPRAAPLPVLLLATVPSGHRPTFRCVPAAPVAGNDRSTLGRGYGSAPPGTSPASRPSVPRTAVGPRSAAVSPQPYALAPQPAALVPQPCAVALRPA